MWFVFHCQWFIFMLDLCMTWFHWSVFMASLCYDCSCKCSVKAVIFGLVSWNRQHHRVMCHFIVFVILITVYTNKSSWNIKLLSVLDSELYCWFSMLMGFLNRKYCWVIFRTWRFNVWNFICVSWLLASVQGLYNQAYSQHFIYWSFIYL